MTIQRTRWRPDTCGCDLIYEWDDAIAQEDRVHTIHRIDRTCPVHGGHANKEDHYKTIKDENISKNKAIGLLVKEGLDPNLAGNVKWRFNPDRSIVVELPAAMASIKTSLNNKVKDEKLAKKVDFE